MHKLVDNIARSDEGYLTHTDTQSHTQIDMLLIIAHDSAAKSVRKILLTLKSLAVKQDDTA